MTIAEFDTLRADLAAVRADLKTGLGALRTEFRTDMDSRFASLRTDIDIRFARLEAKLDEKPGVATIYQASLAMFAGMFAIMIGTVVLLKSIDVIP